MDASINGKCLVIKLGEGQGDNSPRGPLLSWLRSLIERTGLKLGVKLEVCLVNAPELPLHQEHAKRAEQLAALPVAALPVDEESPVLVVWDLGAIVPRHLPVPGSEDRHVVRAEPGAVRLVPRHEAVPGSEDRHVVRAEPGAAPVLKRHTAPNPEGPLSVPQALIDSERAKRAEQLAALPKDEPL
jgi:hypothetical protein